MSSNPVIAHHGRSAQALCCAGMRHLHSALLPSSAIGCVTATRLMNISTSSQASLAVARPRTLA